MWTDLAAGFRALAQAASGLPAPRRLILVIAALAALMVAFGGSVVIVGVNWLIAGGPVAGAALTYKKFLALGQAPQMLAVARDDLTIGVHDLIHRRLEEIRSGTMRDNEVIACRTRAAKFHDNKLGAPDVPWDYFDFIAEATTLGCEPAELWKNITVESGNDYLPILEMGRCAYVRTRDLHNAAARVRLETTNTSSFLACPARTNGKGALPPGILAGFVSSSFPPGVALTPDEVERLGGFMTGIAQEIANEIGRTSGAPAAEPEQHRYPAPAKTH